MARPGRWARTRSVAATTLSTAAWWALPLVENDSIATRGSSFSSARALSAAAMAISDSSSASGFTTSPQSEKISPPLSVWKGSHSIIRKKLDTSRNPGASPISWIALRTTSAVVCSAPATEPSAWPRRTIRLAKHSGSSTARLASSSVMPFFWRKA
ncbi:hypothetical protein FQZ97_839480 [compost metagenome]